MNFKWSYFKFTHQLRLMSSGGKPKSHYESLGIPSNSTQGEVKTAYYKLSMQYHPDKNQSAESSKKFRDITEAYEVLGNARTRRLYDKGLVFRGTSATASDNVDKFHKSRETRSRPPPPTGRTPIYDFDEWSKSHYGATFQRQMEHKRRQKMEFVTRQQEISNNKTDRLIILMGAIMIACMYIFHDRTDYDNVTHKLSYQRPEAESKD